MPRPSPATDRSAAKLAALEYDPRFDRLLAVALVLGVGALAVVVTRDGDVRNSGRLLAVVLIALNAALIIYGISYVNRD
ncbi:hypothetical protein [Halopiger goleimassiliensis]|uniref:hypothetical protein n=1 Tax=Halopiger goleimassiliensis TaxID=1293048 RepID=UPI000677C90E|nr:hypothetical protein [Halopiger goleimassiliensis]